MAEENAFARILNRMSEADAPVSTKTAAANPEPTDSSTRMVATVRTISNSIKTATAVPKNTPAQDLAKMAKEAQDAEQGQLLKQAHFMGAAIADGFMERFAQYDTALTTQGVKTAASPSEDLLKKATEVGYTQAVKDLEKTAEVEFNRGYQDQLQEVQKIAADIHYIGQQTANTIVDEARNTK